MKNLDLRPIKADEAAIISLAFQAQGWDKSVQQYIQYYKDQKSGERDVIIATLNDEFAGYLTIKWQANYLPFKAKHIPEIVDFNVLKKFQRQGLGTALMDEAEKRIAMRSDYAGIGFGVTQDYGAAQILYVKRGYIPDGKGLTLDSRPLPYNEVVSISDDLVFALLKKLK